MEKRKRIWELFLITITTIVICCSCLGQQKDNNNQENIKTGSSETEEHILNEKTESQQEKDTEQNPDTQSPEVEVLAEERIQQQVDDWMESHSLEEKICQLFILTPEQLTGGETLTQMDETFEEIYTQYPIGGLIFFSGNLQTPEQTKTLLDSIQALSVELTAVPAFLSVDEEGGKVVRIADKESFSVENVGNMCEIGASGDCKNAASAGTTIASYLKELGFSLDFAPVADVWTNPQNTVVKERSFGSDPTLVSDMVLAQKAAMEEVGVYPVIKHFPGHGATTGDTHDGYAYTNATYEEMQSLELIPFQRAIEEGVDFIMVSHIAAPNVTGDNTPASLSKYLVTDILRGDMGYNGIVVTDAMNMGAIAEEYSADEAAVGALQAGADLILMSEDFLRAYEGILNAVAEGSLKEARIEESVERILKVKFQIALAETKE